MRKDIFLGKRFAGYIDFEKKVFVTERSEKPHLFRALNGLGFNLLLINGFIESKTVKEIWVYYSKTDGEKVLLKTSPDNIVLHGTRWENTTDIKDTQYILPLEYFERC